MRESRRANRDFQRRATLVPDAEGGLVAAMDVASESVDRCAALGSVQGFPRYMIEFRG